jgi:hypothetical protein
LKEEDRNDIESRLIDYHLKEQDPVKVAPRICKVLLENDQVRVLEIRIKPGGKLPMHSHPAYIVYALRTHKIRLTFPDGKTKEVKVKAGGGLYGVMQCRTLWITLGLLKLMFLISNLNRQIRRKRSSGQFIKSLTIPQHNVRHGLIALSTA